MGESAAMTGCSELVFTFSGGPCLGLKFCAVGELPYGIPAFQILQIFTFTHKSHFQWLCRNLRSFFPQKNTFMNAMLMDCII